MDRRTFLGSVVGGILASSPAARAQQAGRVPVVDVLGSQIGARGGLVDTTRQGLRDRRYFGGKTIAFELRFARGKPASQTRIVLCSAPNRLQFHAVLCR